MSSRQTYVNQMRSWIGKNEYDGSHKEIIDIYNSHKPLARNYKVKYTDSWCATTVSAAAIAVGYTDIIPLECSCGKMVALAQGMGIWQENDSYVPSPGDIIMYDWQDSGDGDDTGWPDHVGVVETCDETSITVIEGNLRDSVARRTISVNGRYIRGFICPRFSESGEEKEMKRFKLLQSMNMRKTPNGALITSVPEGTIIEGTDFQTTGSTQWLYTSYNGKTGYVAVLPESKGYAVEVKDENKVRNFQCVVDAANETGISGWMWDMVSDDKYELHLYVGEGSNRIGYSGIMANIYRADLENAGIGNGSHGFNWDHNLFADFGAGEQHYDLYAITPDGTNPCIYQGTMTINEIKEEEEDPVIQELRALIDKLEEEMDAKDAEILALSNDKSELENQVNELNTQVAEDKEKFEKIKDIIGE